MVERRARRAAERLRGIGRPVAAGRLRAGEGVLRDPLRGQLPAGLGPAAARRRRAPRRLGPAMAGVQPWRGAPYPLGASWDGDGVNFALFSENATGVELCLFDTDGERRLRLADRTDQVWHAYLPGLSPGQRYGYRV